MGVYSSFWISPSTEASGKRITMQDSKTRWGWAGQEYWSSSGFGRLLVFLIVGWLLIFATATLGMQRNVQQSLPVNLVSQVFANYGVDNMETSRLASVRPQIIDAVRQDARLADALISPSPTAVVAMDMAGPKPTAEPALTLTPYPSGLRVSAGGPYIAQEGSSITVVAESIGSLSETVTYHWDLDNDGLYDDAEGISASVVFYDEGDYTIDVQAADLNGHVATDTTTVSVSNVPPTVNAGKDRYANEGEKISFSATASDPGHDVLLYYWDFGDGTGATGTLHPWHTYLDNGNYLVHLRVEDDDGGVTKASFVTYVSNLPPIVDAGPDQVVDEGDSVTFRDIATDPGVHDTLTYAWDLNYDGLTFTPDAFGPTVSTIYPDGPATIVAALHVQDKDGAQTIDTVKVTVNNVAPTIVSVTNNGPVGEGSPLTLVVNATDVGSDTLTYAFDWEKRGGFDAVNQTGIIAHTWYSPGSYTADIRADDGDGGRTFTSTTVSVYNVAPTAVAGPAVVRLEGSPVTFDGSGSGDPGVYDSLTYQWNFGDGSPVADGITVTHTYADNGVYSATLTVADDSGMADTDTVAVTILNANPLAEAGPDRTVNEGEQINLTGTASDPGTADVLSFAWDFSFDGSDFHEEATGPSANWTYPDGPATYVVALRVRDDDYPYPTNGGGEVGESIDTLQVTVNNVPSIAEAGGPYTGVEGQPIVLSGTAVDIPADTLTYEWDLDDDGTFDVTGQTVTTAWDKAGVYTVTLRVTDDDGGIGLDEAWVTVGNAPPTAKAGGPYTGDEGSPIQLIGAGTDPAGDPLTYAWDLDYDGVFETPGQKVIHTWPDDGVYTVTLRVDDGQGSTATDDAIVTVNNVPPIAKAGGPYAATVGTPVTLIGSGTDVPSDTLTYAWYLEDNNGTSKSHGQVVTYTWMTAGTYIVKLQVEDDDGGVTTDATTVDVTP